MKSHSVAHSSFLGFSHGQTRFYGFLLSSIDGWRGVDDYIILLGSGPRKENTADMGVVLEK